MNFKYPSLQVYRLYDSKNTLLVEGNMYDLVNYIIEKDPQRWCYTKDFRRIESSLRGALIRKGKPYGYIIKRSNKI